MSTTNTPTGLIDRLRRPGVWPVAVFLLFVLTALHLMSDAVQNSDELSRVFVPLLAVVLIGLGVLPCSCLST